MTEKCQKNLELIAVGSNNFEIAQDSELCKRAKPKHVLICDLLGNPWIIEEFFRRKKFFFVRLTLIYNNDVPL